MFATGFGTPILTTLRTGQAAIEPVDTQAMSTANTGLRVPGSMTAVLGIRDFRMLWASGGFDNVSRWMDTVAMSLLVLELTDSPFQVALLFVLRWTPMLLFALLSGMLADRSNRWLVMLGARAAAATVTAVLLVLVASGLVQPWHLFIASLLLGWLYVLEWPARRSYIYDIVGGERIVGAMSWETVNSTLGRIIGPFSAGFIIQWSGFTSAFVCLVVGYSLALAMLLMVRARIPARAAGTPYSFWRNVSSGISYAYKNKMIRGVLAGTLIMNGMAFSVESLFPVVARDHLGVGPGLTGLLISAQAMGTLASAVVIGVLATLQHHGRIYCLGLTLQMVALVLFALSPWYPLSFMMLLLAGLGAAGFSTMQSTIILISASPDMRGTALGVLAQCIGIAAVGGLIVGLVADLLSARVAVGLSTSLGLILLMPVIAFSPLVRGRITPPEEEAAPPESGAAREPTS